MWNGLAAWRRGIGSKFFQMILSPSPAMTLSAASSCQEIHDWLSTLPQQLPEWYIHPKLVSYTDQQRKKNELKRINTNKAELPEEYKAILYKDFQLHDTLGTVLPKIRNSGTLILMSGPLYSASDLNQNNSAFHTFVFIYKDNTAIIVDPGYGWDEPAEGEGSVEGSSKGKPGKMRFSSMGGGLGLAINLLRKMKGKNTVLKYWLGKGSELEYDDLNCNTLAQNFVETLLEMGGIFILIGRRKDLRKWEFDFVISTII